MILKSDRYKFRYVDYAGLFRSLRQPNKYRYAAMLKKPLVPSGRSGHRRMKVFKVPEGFLHLAAKPFEGCIDLTRQSLELTPIILVWSPQYQRVRVQVNRRWIRGKLKLAKAASRPFWRGSYRRNRYQYMRYLNTLTLDIEGVLKAGAWIFPETISAYNRKLEALTVRTLTSVFGLPLAEAKKQVKKYLRKLKPRTTHTTALLYR